MTALFTIDVEQIGLEKRVLDLHLHSRIMSLPMESLHSVFKIQTLKKIKNMLIFTKLKIYYRFRLYLFNLRRPFQSARKPIVRKPKLMAIRIMASANAERLCMLKF